MATGTFAAGTAGSPLASATLVINDGTPIALDITTEFSVPTALVDGVNTLDFTVVDQAGTIGNNTYVVDFDDGAPRSIDLIAADEQADKLTVNQGLVTRLFAVTGDPRLPARYQAPHRGQDEDLLHRIGAAFPTMSPDQQDTVEAFLVPPFYAGSGIDTMMAAATPGAAVAAPCHPSRGAYCPLSSNWKSVAGASFRIWYWEQFEAVDLPKAQHLLDVLEGARNVANNVSACVGRNALRDDGSQYNGGDRLYDIALVEPVPGGNSGVAVPHGALPTSGYALIERSAPQSWIDFVAAHEFGHLVEFNTKTLEPFGAYATAEESIAEFCAKTALPETDIHDRDPQFVAEIHAGLLQGTLTHDTRRQLFRYSTYLFLMWLANANEPKVGRDVVAQIWNATETHREFGAYVQAITMNGADLSDVWAHFAIALWNNAPEYPLWAATGARIGGVPYGFESSDYDAARNLDHAVGAKDHVLQAQPADRDAVAASRDNLSIRFAHYTFSDPDVRTILIRDGFRSIAGTTAPDPFLFQVFVPSGAPLTTLGVLPRRTPITGARLTEIVKRDGVWRSPRTWTDVDKFAGGCQQEDTVTLGELVIVESLADPAHEFGPFSTIPSDESTSEVVVDYSHAVCASVAGQGAFAIAPADGGTTPSWSIAATATWKRKDWASFEDGHGGVAILGTNLYLAGGSHSATASGTDTVDGCIWTGSDQGSNDSLPSDAGQYVVVMPWLVQYPDTIEVRSLVQLPSAASISPTAVCQAPDGSIVNESSVQYPGFADFFNVVGSPYAPMPVGMWKMSSDGLGISGDSSYLASDTTGGWGVRSAP